MGKSYTYNVIGVSKDEHHGKDVIRRYECFCMTKLEMAQESKKMADRKTPVIAWFSQTNRGCKMINADFTYEFVDNSKVKHVKTIPCPICKGQGTKPSGKGFSHFCVICNGSGITKNKYWDKWQDWQIEMMKKEFK